jgi:hypothetical protein
MAMKAMQELFGSLKATGRLNDILGRIISLGERSEVLGLSRFYEMERKYQTPPGNKPAP